MNLDRKDFTLIKVLQQNASRRLEDLLDWFAWRPLPRTTGYAAWSGWW